ncbi:fibronectin type III domain-containing protein [Flavobacterium luteum]|uniref:T9SS type A sorting domain-containing protein n=1 Tax=Flavobacterium luteum TaxID=2026654 RepID=A0A7J5ADR9_9FLAO|nr:T9SS type A sorting domain-containing protein [Flavobacterium luteum]KAB1155727.1 T9SS type A sorting domain-containing protein [Flavobacterium luteum]
MEKELEYSKLSLVLFFITFLFFTNIIVAQKTSTGSTDWNVASTWSPAGVPGPLEAVIIRPGDIVTVNTTPINAVASLYFNNTDTALSGITVALGSTLTVTGAVALLNSSTTFTNASISGLGTLLCGSLNVGVPTVTSTVNNLKNTLTISISTLTVSGDITSNNDDPGGKSSQPVWNINSPCNLSANSIIFSHTGSASAGQTLSNFNVGANVTVTLAAAVPIVVDYNINNFRSSMITVAVDPTSTFNFCGTSVPPTSISNSGGTTHSNLSITYGLTNTGNGITLTSGAGTNSPTTPVTIPMLNITFATTGATGATFSGLPLGVIGTWASGAVTISGTPTTVGVYNYTVTTIAAGGCAQKSASGTITTYVCPTFSLLSTTSSSVNVCLGSSSLVTLTATAAGLPVGSYIVSYEIQGVPQTPSPMIVTTAGIGSFVDSGFTSIGTRTITITNIASGLCSSAINTNNIDTVTVVASLAAPTASAGSGATCTQITANWQPMADATYYELDVSTSSTFASFVTGYNALNVGLITSSDIIGLSPGTTYFYRVRAFNGLCISANSLTITYATAGTPNVPSGLTTVSRGCDELKISWTAGSGATNYEVQWSTDNFATILGTATGITVLNYTITGLNTSQPYKYRVRSVNGCNQSSYITSANISLVNSLPGQPGAITIPASPGTFCNQFTINWGTASQAISYKVEWATNSTFTTGFSSVTGITGLTYTITGLTASTGYYFRVFAENGCGFGVVRNGTGSPNITTLTASPLAPTGVTTSSILCSQFTMSWGTSAGAISYTVERALDSGFTAGLVTVTGVLSSPYIFTGLSSGTVYYYRVRAVSCSSSINVPAVPSFVTTLATLPSTPTISASGPLTFCQTDSVTLGSTVIGNSYQWYLNGNAISGETLQFLFVSTLGNYTVQVINTGGCQSAPSLPATVALQGLPTATAGGSQTICSNGVAIISGATATNGTILWTENGAGLITSGATTLTPTYTPAAGDIGNIVTLTMTVTSNNTCAPQIETDTYSIAVTPAIAAPTISTITQPMSCSLATGSVLLINLPAGGIINPGNISYLGTSCTISGLTPSIYNYTITSGSCTSPTSADVLINPVTLIDNIWKTSGWSRGFPPSSDTERIIFEAPSFSSTVDLKGCSCQVNSGTSVTINSGHNLTLTNEITVYGTLTLENNASLIQINDNVINSGDINVKRTSRPMYRWDYVYHGSPVAGNIFSQIPIQYDLKYKYVTNKTFTGIWTPLTATVEGEGFITRVRNITPFNVNPTPIDFIYTGVPNNGLISTSGTTFNGGATTAYGNSKVLANPYPCALDAKLFLDDPNNKLYVGGTIYLWTSTTVYSGTGAYNVSDYIPWNKTGSTIGIPPPGISFDGKIASGQGFMVQMIADGPINFKNYMRIKDFNSNFLRVSNHSIAEVSESHRIWLNMTNETSFRQTLIGYVDGATNSDDRSYDGLTITNSKIDLYSIVDEKALNIQGRALPFNENDIVNLGYKSATLGKLTIAIGHVDGLFSENQEIYLEDKVLNSIHNLKQSPYEFTSEVGTFNNRFIIRYTNPTLGVTNQNIKIGINAFIKNKKIAIQAPLNIISISIFDLTGKLIKTNTPKESLKHFEDDFLFAEGIYLAKIQLEDDSIVTKKLIR